MPKWVIRWECQHCNAQFIEERTTAEKTLLVYKDTRTDACACCGHVGCEVKEMQYIEHPRTGSSASNLFGGIRP